ncbi:acyltransferase family protein [Actinospongicola halichondriae]|uniref:acyltransferase family protein n=1 Tax=Actinospongicola halichondriae TaxID=3236844 RepID=UPI003D45B0B9
MRLHPVTTTEETTGFTSVLDDLTPRWSTRRPLRYLPGLDGIRAVSVAAVVAYHLDYSWATGGYLGVEVFFVLSGFLITRLLLDEEWRTGTVSRPAFWLRRARRLLPAVVALVIGVWVWTVVVLSATEAARFRGDAFASLLYVQNWHAILADQPYFEAFGRPSPLRHLWSLAIEEQFYLLWPLVLPVSLKRFGRRPTAALIGVAVVASLWAMQITADIAAPERAYFGTDTRAFGILLGGVLAFAWTPERLRAGISVPARRMVDAVGLAALAALVWQFSGRSEFDPWTYPWGFLWVDVCTIALLLSATHPASTTRRLLGSRALTAIGRRSYSLYLWHWPVIVFTRPDVDWGLTGASALVVRLGLIVALSELSYRCIEQPFRDGRVQDLARRLQARIGVAPARRVGLAGAALASVAVVALLAAPTPSREIATSRAPLATTTTTTTTLAPSTTEEPEVTAPPTTEAETSSATLPADGGPLTIIGESVTLGAVDRLLGHYGDRLHIDAVKGRRASESIAFLQQLAADDRLRPTVVLHIGNNGAISSDSFNAAYDAVGPDRNLVLVRIRVPRRWEEQVNGEIDRLAAEHDNVIVADWNHIANTEPGLLTDDGVHLSSAGIDRYTEMLAAIYP